MKITENEEFKEGADKKIERFTERCELRGTYENTDLAVESFTHGINKGATLAQTILEKEHEEFCEWLATSYFYSKKWFKFGQGMNNTKTYTFAELKALYQKEKETQGE